MTAQEQRGVVRTFMPNAKTIRFSDTGEENEVYIVDDELVFRFPKDEAAKKALLFECELLEKLKGKVTLRIPIVVDYDKTGVYGVCRYIPGNVRKNSEICRFDSHKKAELAVALTQFINELNGVVDPAWLTSFPDRSMSARIDSFEYYEVIAGYTEAHRSDKSGQYLRWYESLKSIRDEVYSQSHLAILHGDLHGGNLIFDKQDNLVGVIDFGDCVYDTIYNELKVLARLGPEVVEHCIKHLGQAFGTIKRDYVRTCVMAHEYSVLVRTSSSDERKRLASEILHEWGEV
ncbi:MAG: aminoglycoside phosphotransferase family protein [Candidatus Saccharimonadales bacterium]